MRICCINQHDVLVSSKSGMEPLAGVLEADVAGYRSRLNSIRQLSWSLARTIELASRRFYGSAWNQLVPVVDELGLLRQMGRERYDMAHFLWGEFATPSLFPLFRRKAQRIIGTFHCSQRRQWRVTMKPRWYMNYDHIALVSKTQCDYFIDNGYPETCISVIPLGIDLDYFSFSLGGKGRLNDPLECVLVGNTERDHLFAAKIMAALGRSSHLTVCTAKCNQHYYEKSNNITISPYLSDDELVTLYQRSDLLLMPMLDCTANDAILESMSCGTPVMVNCVGGIPEYVDPKCNVVMIGKKTDEWVDILRELIEDREKLYNLRPIVREWVGRFDWQIIAGKYIELYNDILAAGS